MSAGRSVSLLLMVVLLLVFGAASWFFHGGTPAQADPVNTTWCWMVGQAVGSALIVPGPPPCFLPRPDARRRDADGNVLILSGHGTYGPGKAVTGGGDYTIEDPDGGLLMSGTFTPDTLESFHEYGPTEGSGPDCTGPPNPLLLPSYRAGKWHAKVTLHDDVLGDIPAKLTIWCRLPCVTGLPKSVPEAIRLKIGSWDFNSHDPASGGTVFIDGPCPPVPPIVPPCA